MITASFVFDFGATRQGLPATKVLHAESRQGLDSAFESLLMEELALGRDTQCILSFVTGFQRFVFAA